MDTVPFGISVVNAISGSRSSESSLQGTPLTDLISAYHLLANEYWNTYGIGKKTSSRDRIVTLDHPYGRKEHTYVVTYPCTQPSPLPPVLEGTHLTLQEKISSICNELIRRIIDGDAKALKEIYTTSFDEHPAMIRTISELQEWLTSVEIANDKNRIYSNEFLYYWAMICCGDNSELIQRELGTARTCLEKIQDSAPLAKA